jgi:hypothetical protein
MGLLGKGPLWAATTGAASAKAMATSGRQVWRFIEQSLLQLEKESQPHYNDLMTV